MDPDFPNSSGSQDSEKGSSRFGGDQGWPRWMIGVLAAVIIAVIFLPSLLATQSGNAITFGFEASFEGNAVKVTYSGTVDKDAMKGSVRFGDLGEGTFTGKKK